MGTSRLGTRGGRPLIGRAAHAAIGGRRSLLAAIAAAWLAGAAAAPAAAAGPIATARPGPDQLPVAVPQIAATGNAEIRVPPTKASFTIGVITEADSAAKASAENARTYRKVMQALQQARLAAGEILGSHLTVYPRWVYDESSHRQRRAGFSATHTIEIETTSLERLGAYVDAAVDAGASSISSIEFAAENPAAARHQVLEQAVQNARADAQAMARAAGGSLGELLLISTEQPGNPRGVAFEPLAAGVQAPRPAATTILPETIRITAHVLARWKFVPAGR